VSVEPPSLEAPCRVCGWLAQGARLCLGCQEIHDWARINRAFCDVVHRQAPLPPYAGDGVLAFLARHGCA